MGVVAVMPRKKVTPPPPPSPPLSREDGATKTLRMPGDLALMLEEVMVAEHYKTMAELIDELFRAAITARHAAAMPLILQVRELKKRRDAAGS